MNLITVDKKIEKLKTYDNIEINLRFCVDNVEINPTLLRWL